MREMVLNHASLRYCPQSEIICKLKDMADGMIRLVRSGVTSANFRTHKFASEISCTPNHSLLDAYLLLNQAGLKEQFLFLMHLTSKTPLLSGVGEDIKSRFLACETIEFSQEDGQPMLLCTLNHWITVGFPKAPWDCDQITISFNELLPDESIETVDETIDNLTRSRHADPIRERHQSLFRAGLNLWTLWGNRNQAFPNLNFGPEVEGQISNLPKDISDTVMHRLAELHSAASDWLVVGGAMPNWPCKVTSESSRVRNNPKLREARCFRSHHGDSRLFLRHARFGNSGRIHLHVDPQNKEVEIGYIGRHLPL